MINKLKNSFKSLSISFFIIFSLATLVLTLSRCGMDPAHAFDVNLEWQANTDKDLAGYKLYSGNKSREYIISIDVGDIPNFTITGLLERTTTYFSVKSYDTSGKESLFSDEIVKVIGNFPPEVPLNFMGRNNDDDIEVLTWDANQESDLAGYKLYIGTNSGIYNKPIILSSEANSYITETLNDNAIYYMVLTSFDNIGAESDMTNEVIKVVNLVPAKPTDLQEVFGE